MFVMKWLHLSDIHFNIGGYDTSVLKSKLIEFLKEQNMDFIVITGDVFYKNKVDVRAMKEVENYIREICLSCNCDKKNIYICQGNHDLDRDNASRNKLIDDIRNHEKEFTSSYEKLCENGNSQFMRFYKNTKGKEYQSYAVYCPKNSEYRIISINSSLLSKDDKDTEKLRVCNDELDKLRKKIKQDRKRNGDKLNILIMHHSVEMLEASDGLKFQHWLEDNNIDIVLCGHTHRASTLLYNDTKREIMQFTAGSTVIDNYSYPSFYIYEKKDGDPFIYVHLYYFSLNTEQWVLDSVHLRKFEDGTYKYNLARMKTDFTDYLIAYRKVVDNFNKMFYEKFGTMYVYSEKNAGNIEFNSWKIIRSLIEVGCTYEVSIDITHNVMQALSDSSFKLYYNCLTMNQLRTVIYNEITSYNDGLTATNMVVIASRYARKYAKSKTIKIINDPDINELNYDIIKSKIIKSIITDITGDSLCFNKIPSAELSLMAERILEIIKKLEIYEIDINILKSIIIQHITQRPHPWVVQSNMRYSTIRYHTQKVFEHIKELNRNENKTDAFHTFEASYHICAGFVSFCNDFIGCSETMPISNLQKSINYKNTDDLGEDMPIPRYKIIELKKVLKDLGYSFEDFKKYISIIFELIVKKNESQLKSITEAMNKLNQMLFSLSRKKHNLDLYKIDTNILPFNRIFNIFSNAEGFVVKKTTYQYPNCFWVEPNWQKHEVMREHLSKQMLACVLKNANDDINYIYDYLYNRNKQFLTSEIIFALEDYSHFTKDERMRIREVFKGKSCRIIFIQESNYLLISENYKWREILFNIISQSRMS